MGEDGEHHLLYVVGDHVFASLDEGVALDRARESDRPARADPDRQLVVRSRAMHDLQNVIADRVVHADLAHGRLQCEHLVDGDDRLQAVDRLPQPVREQHRFLGSLVGVADVHADHEPVQLVFRKRVSPLELVGILRRQYEEWAVERVGLPLDGNLPLHHRFEQRALRARGRAVDLVGQQDLREDRAGPELELPLVGEEHAAPQDVAGEHVGGELQPRELTAEAERQGLGERGLSDSRSVLDQQMPLRQQGHERQPNGRLLAQDRLRDVVFQALNQRVQG